MLAVPIAATLISIAFILHCAVVGGGLMRAVACTSDKAFMPGHSTAFFTICVGMLLNMLTLAGLGMMGWLTPLAVASFGGLLLAVGLMGHLAAAKRATRTPTTSGAATAERMGEHMGGSRKPQLHYFPRNLLPGRRELLPEYAALGVIFLLCIAVSLHPPGHWDDTMYQLPIARHYLGHGAIVLNEYLRFPLFPQHGNMLFSLGMMLGEGMQPWIGSPADDGLWHFGLAEILAQTFATLPLFVIALGLWSASHRYLDSGIPGLLAGLLLFMIGPVKSTLGFAYVDNALALYCWAAALAIAVVMDRPRSDQMAAMWQKRLCRFHWALAGLLAGAACGIKYFGVVYAAGLGVLVMTAAWLHTGRSSSESGAWARASDPFRKSAASRFAASLHAAVVYGVAVVFAGSLWYVRNYVVSGDPAHPAGASVFGYFLWDEVDLAGQHAEQASYGVGRNPVRLPAAMLAAGVLPWLPALAGLFLRRVSAGIRVLQAVFIGYLFFWFFVTQVPRYLAPIYGVGCFLSLHFLWEAARWCTARLRHSGITAAARRILGPAMDGRASTRGYSASTGKGVNCTGSGPAAMLVLAACVLYLADRGLKHGREFMNAEAVLATRPGYSLYQQANRNADAFGHRLVQVGFENGIYFFNGTVIGDWFGPGRYRGLLECDATPCPLPPSERLRDALRRHDACMLMLNRELVKHLDEDALRAQGWQVLASEAHGVLLATDAAGK